MQGLLGYRHLEFNETATKYVYFVSIWSRQLVSASHRPVRCWLHGSSIGRPSMEANPPLLKWQMYTNNWSLDCNVSAAAVRRQYWGVFKHTLTCRIFSPAEAAGARRKQSGLMKYSSLKFKASTVGPVKGWPRDGDVSRSFMTPETFLSVSLKGSR